MTTTGITAPVWDQQFFDNNGVVAAGYQVFCYLAGTTTKTNTYSDGALTVPNSNPVILDSAGRLFMYLASGSYKFVLAPPTDTDPPTSPLRTMDNVLVSSGGGGSTSGGSADIPATFGVTTTAGQAVYLSDGSESRIAGDWYLTDSGNINSSSIAPFVGFVLTGNTAGNTGLVRIIGEITGLVGLTPGTFYYAGVAGAITASVPTNGRLMLFSDSSTSGVIGGFQNTATGTFTNLVVTGSSSLDNGSIVTDGVGSLTVSNFTTGDVSSSSAPIFRPGGDVTGYDATGDGYVFNYGATAGNITSGETTLYTYTLPAAVFQGNGAIITFEFWYKSAANGNTKTVKLYFGAASVTLQSGISNNIVSYFRGIITDLGATSQGIYYTVINGSSSYGTATNTYSATASGTNVIKLTGQATSTNDIVVGGFTLGFRGNKQA